MNILISLLCVGLNGYIAYRSYQRGQWLWFGLSLALGLWCAWPFLALL